jgi:hypothetical protein
MLNNIGSIFVFRCPAVLFADDTAVWVISTVAVSSTFSIQNCGTKIQKYLSCGYFFIFAIWIQKLI